MSNETKTWGIAVVLYVEGETAVDGYKRLQAIFESAKSKPETGLVDYDIGDASEA